MIKQIELTEFYIASEVICKSFITVAKEFEITEQNCPKYVGFITTAKRLQAHHSRGWQIFGFYENERLVGCVLLSKSNENENTYELHNLAVLPEYRHKNYGRQLLDYCITSVVKSGGNRVKISIIEENNVLKNWYTAFGFVHTGIKKFEHLPFTSGYMELEVSLWESKLEF